MFNEEMFTVEAEDRQYAIKPMNCPCHMQVFKQGLLAIEICHYVSRVWLFIEMNHLVLCMV